MSSCPFCSFDASMRKPRITKKSVLALICCSVACSNRVLAFSHISASTNICLVANSFRSSSTSSTALCMSNELPHLQTQPLPPKASLTSPNLLQKLRLRLGFGKALRERVVHKYFHGVDTKNISQITECFPPTPGGSAIIRDICSLTNRDVMYEDVGKMVTAGFLGERCREFLDAHPDAKVLFHYG